jgi:hypothetical protein
MSDLNSVPFTDQNSTYRVRKENQDRNDNRRDFLDVRHMKGSEGQPGTKRKLHNLVQDSDSINEQDDDGMRDPKRTFYQSETPALSQERSTSFQSNDICDECRSINLHVLVKEAHVANYFFLPKRYAAPWKRDEDGTCLRAGVGFRFRQKQFACALCRTLAASRITTGKTSGAKKVGVQDNGDEIRVTPFPTWTFNRLSDSGRRIVCLILAPQESSVNYSGLHHHAIHNGSLILFDNSTDLELFHPQPISPSLDCELIGSWLKYCTKYHRLLCHLEPVPVSGVQVINCTTLEIEHYNASTPYVSLSYVWGKSNDARGHVKTIGGRKALPQLLPRVIKDSIKVTKALGYRYLWIDKFCIDQDAADLKHDQIQQMDAIYANSQLTIIGAAGQDESYGLPGVGARNRPHRFIAKLDGATVLWNPNDPHEAISQSHWSTRGWTFQEALLSRRRMVFTEDQVYFQCNTMNCFESNHCALDKLHVKDKSKTLETVRSGIFGQTKLQPFGKLVRDKESLNESFRRYLSNVEDYTSRNLSFDEDSLNAFQGIIKQFSQERYAFNHFWGLAYPSNGPRSLDVFVQSLTWIHRAKTKARRRNLFPSWTWAGWEGHIEYEVSRSKNVCFDNALHDLRFQGLADGSLSLEELGEHRSHAVLKITATALSLGPNAYRGAEQARMPWRIASHEAILSWSSGDRTDAELAEMFKDTSRWQFVYIGAVRAVYKSYFVMILELGESGLRWQRVGMFRVVAYNGTFKHSLKGNPTCTYEIE